MASATVLIVDDEDLIRWSLRERLSSDGYDILDASTGQSALIRYGHGAEVVLLDDGLPDQDGLSVLRDLKRIDPDALVIFLASPDSVETVVDAMKLGAFHFAIKPVDPGEVAALVARALETTRLRREVKQLRDHDAAPYTVDAIVGESVAMTALRQAVSRTAASPASTVLLTGERGTGKDLVARTIHYSSSRAPRPLLIARCSALPPQQLESELFGHERGAFAGAHTQKRGLLELADGGTVLLDEIGELAVPLQAKLLRFLGEKSFKRAGGTADIRVDVRVVAATTRNLDEQVARGGFRSDLYYRLSVSPIRLPPLREHLDDVPALVSVLVKVLNGELTRKVTGISPDAIALLKDYAWPGNVRELRNVLERAMLLTGGSQLQADDLPGLKGSSAVASTPFELPAAGVHLDDVERSLVVQALRRAHGNQTRAAALLGLNRDQIRYRIEKFGLSSSHDR